MNMGCRHKGVIDIWCFIQVLRGFEVIYYLNRDGKN